MGGSESVPKAAKPPEVSPRCLPILLLCALLPLAPAAASGDPASATSAAAPRSVVPVQRFRFQAGAPLLAPAGVGSDGSVCVGTADGYVHLLAADGSFRWSHAVRGAVTRRPVFSGELWYVATSAERVYALTQTGTLYWVFKPPSAVASELATDGTGILYFVGTDHYFYGVTAHGGVSLRTAFGDLKVGPIEGPEGAVWAENQAGLRLRARGSDVRRLALESGPEFDFGSTDSLRDPEGHVWRVRSDGVLEFSVAPGSDPTTIKLAASPLLAPAWSPSARCAVLSARDGLVVALGLGGERDRQSP